MVRNVPSSLPADAPASPETGTAPASQAGTEAPDTDGAVSIAGDRSADSGPPVVPSPAESGSADSHVVGSGLAGRGSSRTGRDMAISLLVLLIPLAVVVTLFRLRGGEDVVVVDPAAAIAQARAAGAFPVAAPTGLGPEWKAISAQFRRDDRVAELRIGYLTPSGGEVQLVESSEDVSSLLAHELGDKARPADPVVVAGALWERSVVRDGQTALVLFKPGHTVVVVGHAQMGELTTLAASLPAR